MKLFTALLIFGTVNLLASANVWADAISLVPKIECTQEAATFTVDQQGRGTLHQTQTKSNLNVDFSSSASNDVYTGEIRDLESNTISKIRLQANSRERTINLEADILDATTSERLAEYAGSSTNNLFELKKGTDFIETSAANRYSPRIYIYNLHCTYLGK